MEVGHGGVIPVRRVGGEECRAGGGGLHRGMKSYPVRYPCQRSRFRVLAASAGFQLMQRATPGAWLAQAAPIV